MEPPEEFADWHDSTTSFLRAGGEALDDAPEPGEGTSEAQVEQYIISVLSPAAFEHGPKITEILNGMDRDAITAMIEADCIDEEVLEGR